MERHNWCVRLWGVRGSFPQPDAEHLEYGGSTSCISVELEDTLAVLDAGSGLAALGEHLVREGRRRVDIFISHLHLDHVMGLFSFAPRCDRRTELHLYGMPGIAQALTRLIAPPLWPIDLASGGAQIHIHEVLADSPFPLAGGAGGGFTAAALEGNHPGGCYYYRLEQGGRSLVYALDCELAGDMAHRLTAFARGTDLLVWDASFAPGDLRPGWGHSTWEQGLELGQAAGAKQVLMTHYSGGYPDKFLREQERLASQASALSCFGKEGMVIWL